MRAHTKRQIRKVEHLLPYFAWGIALISTVGSLALSEIFQMTPCVLCWYQRILMYPLVVIVGVGVLRRDRNWVHYALPMAVGGTLVAFYQSLLQWGILPETVAPCNIYVSCVTRQIDWLGFITIPFMSFLAFAAITAMTAAYWWVRPSLGE